MNTTRELVPAVYEALQARAQALLQARGGSLSPASLVHDVLVKLYQSQRQDWADERHFRAAAALAMRQILQDRARRNRSAKHQHEHATFSLSGLASGETPMDALALQRALETLESDNPRAAEVVVYRLFGGLQWQELAETVGRSETTVKREWRVGRAWVCHHIEAL